MKYVLDKNEVKEAIIDYMVRKGLANQEDLVIVTLQTSSSQNISCFDCANVVIEKKNSR